MNVTLYQIIPELDLDHFIFRDLHTIQSACGGYVPEKIYGIVYDGHLEAGTLEDIYYIFNVRHPNGYRGRSLSISDVVEVHTQGRNSAFYYCDTIGFTEIKFDKSKVSICHYVQNKVETDTAERKE